MPLTSGTPRWQKVATFVLLVLIAAVVIGVYVRSGTTNAAVNATTSQGDRRDCVTTLSTARRAVFDDVTVYSAISTQLLNGSLLRQQVGLPLAQGERDELVRMYGENNTALTKALVEARRVQPAKFLDGLIAEGGDVAGIHYDACPD